MPQARRTESAERDLRNIAYYIAFNDKRPATADRLIDEITEQAESLARLSTSAEMGTACPEIGKGVRLYSFKRWVILFRYEPHGIDVLRIADARQDYLSWKL